MGGIARFRRVSRAKRLGSAKGRGYANYDATARAACISKARSTSFICAAPSLQGLGFGCRLFTPAALRDPCCERPESMGDLGAPRQKRSLYGVYIRSRSRPDVSAQFKKFCQSLEQGRPSPGANYDGGVSPNSPGFRARRNNASTLEVRIRARSPGTLFQVPS